MGGRGINDGEGRFKGTGHVSRAVSFVFRLNDVNNGVCVGKRL